MLEDLISIGDKIEMSSIKRTVKDGEDYLQTSKKVYHSALSDVLTDEQVEILMPIEQSKLILLPEGSEYSMEFQSIGVVYKCTAKVLDRYKSEEKYLIRMELTSSMKKHQRRQFYRYDCVLEMNTRILTNEEVRDLNEGKPFTPNTSAECDSSTAIDLSGGGMRILSSVEYTKNSLILCDFILTETGKPLHLTIPGQVINVKRMERKKINEYRIQFYKMDNELREEIIRFIFDAERKRRRTEKNR